GHISFSSDLWSDLNLVSFMALTSHFLSCDNAGHLHLDSHLLAFQVVDGKHGNNITKIIFNILIEAHLLEKVRSALSPVLHHLILFWQLGQFTLDNTSNCDTLMEWLELYIRKEGIPFNHIGNHIRYIFY
ncbi:hypothetical protein EDB86DRAFT_2818446, partial [Lactarius hatsudake]